MTNKINYRYFWGKLKLPYLSLSPFKDTPTGAAVSSEIAELDRQITRYQKEFFTNLFGSDILPEEVESYIVDEESFISPLANFVYCKILSTYQSGATASGITIKQSEVSNVVSYQENVFDAWNEMLHMNITIRQKIDTLELTGTYPIEIYTNCKKKEFWSLKFWI